MTVRSCRKAREIKHAGMEDVIYGGNEEEYMGNEMRVDGRNIIDRERGKQMI